MCCVLISGHGCWTWTGWSQIIAIDYSTQPSIRIHFSVCKKSQSNVPRYLFFPYVHPTIPKVKPSFLNRILPWFNMFNPAEGFLSLSSDVETFFFLSSLFSNPQRFLTLIYHRSRGIRVLAFSVPQCEKRRASGTRFGRDATAVLRKKNSLVFTP